MTPELKNDIIQWLHQGAEFRAGLELYVKAVGRGHSTIYILRKYSLSNHEALITALSRRAGVQMPEPPRLQAKEQSEPPDPPKKKLREDYTFLDDPKTPSELKILVSNKITAYNEYKKYHAKLFDCKSTQEELDVARHLVENYIENYTIHKELHHYRKNKTILGHHPIFEEMKRLKAFRSTSTRELLEKRHRIKHNIWRIQKLIDSGDKPYLLFQRQQKLALYKLELDQIEEVIGE